MLTLIIYYCHGNISDGDINKQQQKTLFKNMMNVSLNKSIYY